MSRVLRLRSILALLLSAFLLCLPPVAAAQSTPQVCDCDADGDIDKVDINLIANGRGQAATGPTDPRDPDRDNKITSADARTCTQRCTFAGCGSPTNRPPIADAGPDQTVFTDQEITLDGSDSTDPDGDPLTFRWSFVRKPAGSAANLTSGTSVSPRFIPDIDGVYEIQLIVRDGQVDSAPDTVVITTGNAPPVADAGDDQTAVVNQLVTVDGSDSSDINGDPLTYSWSFVSRPSGSNATLSSSNAVMPTFTPDRAGIFRLRLIVNDGRVNSQPDEVVIDTRSVPNEPPIADAGDDQTIDLGVTVTLDGSGSHDPEGSPLTFAWSMLTRPAGSTAVLAIPNGVGPTFLADRPGEYVIQLIVNDGTDSSAPDTVRITTRNTRPVADAGDDQSRNVGDTVALDGTGSFDDDGDPLSYSWSFTSRPNGSNATIANPAQPTTSFVADLPGIYVAQLVVNDGQFDSLPDTARITVVVPTVPALSINDATIAEGNAGTRLISFTVSLSPAATSAVTVSYATADGSATTANSDYVAKNAVLTYTAGQTSKTVTVTVRGDTTFETDEQFFVNLTNESANASISDAQGIGTITNDDAEGLPTVTIEATDAAASETGPNVGVMRVTRTGSTAAGLTVSTSITGSTATNTVDFTTVSTVVQIPVGAAFADVTFTPVDDALVEGPEAIVRTISANANYTVGTPSSATITIADNDTLPTITIEATDANASETGSNVGVMRVTRTGSTAAGLTVSTSITGSTATNTTDFATVSTVVQIPAGAAFADVTFTPVDDALVEGPETIVRTISVNANYVVGTPSQATVTIADNDTAALPTVTVLATDANASETGSNTGTFTISRTGPTTAALLVVGSFGGTAINGSDYSTISTSVSIPIGQSSVTRTVTPIDDTVDESDETVIYEIGTGAYVIGAQDSATVTIADNDTATLPTVTIVATDAAAGETSPNPGSGRFTVSRTGATTSPLIVLLSISGSATNGSDYQTITAGVTIPVSSASATVDVVPINDTAVETAETVLLSVTANAGVYLVGSPSSAQVNIADNDVGALLEFVTPTLNIGQNLQASQAVRVSAGNAPAGGLALRIVSSSANVLLSATDTGTGAQTLNTTIPANTAQSLQFFVYALASSGTASLTVEIVTTPNPGFSPGTPGSVAMSPAGYELLCQNGGCTSSTSGHGISTTAQAAPSLIYIQAQRLNTSTSSNRAGNQNVRGGTTINLPLALANSNLGAFRAYNNGTPGSAITQLSIPAGEYFTYFYFDPNDASSGSSTISFTKPAGAGTPLNNSAPYAQSMPVTVAGATPINFINPTQTVGRDRQLSNYLVLGAPAPAGGLSLRLTSSNADVILSSSATTAGTQTLDITVPAGVSNTSGTPFYVQSLASSGTANVTVQVLTSPNPGFTAGSPYVATLAPSGFQLFCFTQGCSFDAAANRDVLTTINSNTNRLMYIEAYLLNTNATNNIVGTQNVRGGFSITMALTLTNTGIGVLRDYPSAGTVISQITIPGGTYFTYFYLDPNNSSTGGNGVINYTKPATAGTPTAGGTSRRQSMSVVVTQ